MKRAKWFCESAVMAAVVAGVFLTGCTVDDGGLVFSPTVEATADARPAADVTRPDTSPPACVGTPDITIDRDCCAGCEGRPCLVGLGLEAYPCAFGDGWVVAACSQCWGLP